MATLFIDYGQAPRLQEAKAARALAQRVGSDHREVAYSGRRFWPGEIRGRNAFLVHAALLTWDAETGSIGLGIHAHSVYADCSPEFVGLMQGSLDLHSAGQLTLSAPFISWTKGEVFAYALELDVPLQLTYGCESDSEEPCERCESCRDRKRLFARAQ